MENPGNENLMMNMKTRCSPWTKNRGVIYTDSYFQNSCPPKHHFTSSATQRLTQQCPEQPCNISTALLLASSPTIKQRPDIRNGLLSCSVQGWKLTGLALGQKCHRNEQKYPCTIKWILLRQSCLKWNVKINVNCRLLVYTFFIFFAV